MRKNVIIGSVVAGLAAVGLAASPAQAISATTADLFVLHAIPATPVDIYVNGALTIDDFQPGTLAGPLDLPAGAYTVAITQPDAVDDSAPIIPPVSLTLAAGTSYTAAAHLTEASDPTVTLFTNNLAPTAPGQGRLTVRHIAAAPAVDILAGGAPVISSLTNPNESTLDLPAGTLSVSVALAGTVEPVIGPVDVAIQDGVNTIVYAWGFTSSDLALAVQTIRGIARPPIGVPAGEAGLVANTDVAPGALTASGLALLLFAGLGIRMRRGAVRVACD